jgi:DNA-binding beta-propeller fold protein YncE
VHGLSITPDGVVWVADRVGNRIQQFHIDGTFIKEAFVARATRNAEGTVYGFSFSKDPQMTYVYVADGSNKKVHILDRLTLKEVGFVGGYGGQMPGSFNHLHGTAVDSLGNLYTGEAAAGARIQRWVLKQ